MQTKTKKKYIYISGKISGLSEAEYIANFEAAKQYLIEQGYEAVSPLDYTGTDWEYGRCLLACTKLLKLCGEIYLLDNYIDSNGAMIELEIAYLMKRINPDFKIIHEINLKNK